MIRESEDRAFTFAFQPIVDVASRRVFSYEALIRGTHNEPASYLLGGLPAEPVLPFPVPAVKGLKPVPAELPRAKTPTWVNFLRVTHWVRHHFGQLC